VQIVAKNAVEFYLSEWEEMCIELNYVINENYLSFDVNGKQLLSSKQTSNYPSIKYTITINSVLYENGKEL